jgi:hypothetical protein
MMSEVKEWLDYNRFFPAAFAFFQRARAAAAIFALAAADMGLRFLFAFPVVDAEIFPDAPKIRSRSLWSAEILSFRRAACRSCFADRFVNELIKQLQLA